LTISRVLVANRGEVAVRVARAVRDAGGEACGVFAADEAGAAYLTAMTTRARLPGSGAAAYLDADALVAAAVKLQAGTLHPGWGFLSESPKLALACAQAGIVFVGPSPDVLALCGDKRRTRDLAVGEGLPVAEAVRDIGGATSLLASTPIMLKAAAGGGGRGMRIVRDPDSLAAAWAEASAEAAAFFGDGAMFAEALIENARHIEVQIAGDGAACVSLGTRDCSLQRRHQKLVETAPASAACMPALEDAARRMAMAMRYRGLGTWEFLVRGRDFVFLEVNPRLQVEHTVTEAVTGLDLVQIQLALAAGATLAQLRLATPPRAAGWAIQLRINAEILSRDGGVRPSAGTLTRFRPPGGPGVRVDHAAVEGAHIGVAYDSLLAKLIVHAPDREACLRRAARALDEFDIEGVATNLPVLRRLLTLPAMRQDALNTQLLESVLADIVAPDTPGAQADHAVVVAPMAGLLVKLLAAVGDTVQAGQSVALLEAMKMQMELRAASAGIVLHVAAHEGDVLREGDLVLRLAVSDHTGNDTAPVAMDLDLVRPDLAALQARVLATLDEGRAEAVARRHAAGKRMARENLGDLFDAGSFAEYGALAVAAQRRRRSMEDLIRVSPADGLVCGIGTVAQRPVAAMAYDFTVMAGTQGFLNHKKTDRLLGVVAADNLPLVLFAEGGGGRPGDSDVMGVAGLDLTTFAAFAARSGQAPLLGIASGSCFAGNAAMLGCCDTVIATADSSIGMGGPAMIEGGGLGRFRPAEVGPVSVQVPNGVIDVVVADEAEAVRQARRYLGYFDGVRGEFAAADQRLLRHAVPEDRKRIYDMRALINNLADADSVFELRAGFAAGIITALVRVEGVAFGLMANNPFHLGGAIDAPAADKAARFLQLCDAHGLPVISLCDTPGFMVGPDTERTAQVRHVCRMFVTGAALRVPVFCIVPRKGYGLGAMAMAGGGFHQSRFTIAWPSGEFGGMGLEGAVRLGYRRELEAEPTPEAREALFERLVGTLYEEGRAINMASYVEIDAVIDPAETRAWIMRGWRSAQAAATQGQRPAAQGQRPAAQGQRPAAQGRRPAARFIDTW
jgi:acetyl/propionyl-CoA carboxylase alpha subunit/acetyl-CoA carboxylase carboxyltransferase component